MLIVKQRITAACELNVVIDSVNKDNGSMKERLPQLITDGESDESDPHGALISFLMVSLLVLALVALVVGR